MDTKRLAELLFPDITETPEDLFKKYPKRNLPAGSVVTRFAPSPTGMMHIGNFFQMFISYNLRRVCGGVFYLRIEDTDNKREVKGATKLIYDILNRFGIEYDEYQTLDGTDVGDYGPYVQSERRKIYQVFAKKLVAEGKAFPCFCKKTEGKEDVLQQRKTKYLDNDSCEYDVCRNLSLQQVQEHLANGENFAIRLRTKHEGNERVKFHDLIKGEIEAKANAKDFILLKNDGIPPYPFAHAVDDTLMGTTICVRGEEYISSTPMHIELFEALGFPQMTYCHNPLICKIGENGNRRKISKRYDPEANMMFYFEQGYPVEAVLEYLLNIINSGFESWRTKNPNVPWQDFQFGVHDITAVSPVFDMLKLNDISKNVIATMTAEEVYERWYAWACEFKLGLADYLKSHRAYAVQVCGIGRGGLKPRKDIYCWSQIESEFGYMFHELKNKEEIDDLNAYTAFMQAYSKQFMFPSDKDAWFTNVKEVAVAQGFALDNKAYKANPDAFKGNLAKACEFIRIALTGKANAPDIYELMTILGAEETKKRLKNI